MAIVNNVTVDNGLLSKVWKIPSGDVVNSTFVPRGLMVFQGTKAVAAVGAGDTLQLRVSLTFPDSYQYLLKSLVASFLSDDGTCNMDTLGSVQWATPQATNPIVQFDSPGTYFVGTTLVAGQTYQLNPHTPRPLINVGDVVHIDLSDTTGTSTAGDVRWYAEFFAFDQEQALSWPVNSPQPVVCY